MSNPNPKNQFESGKSGNPNGRPKKGETITDVMRELLKKKVETKEGKKELKELFCQKVMEKALKGDLTAIKLMWNYLDGMPVQTNVNENTNNDIKLIISEHEKQL